MSPPTDWAQLVERTGPGEPAADAAAALARAGLGPVRTMATRSARASQPADRADHAIDPAIDPAVDHAADPAAPVVYHATPLDRYLPLQLATETSGPVVIVAHGLAKRPASDGALARLEPAWARDLAVSAAALASLAPRVRAVVAHDAATAADAVAIGLPEPTLVHPLGDPMAWRRAESNPATVHHVADTMRTTVITCEAALTPLVPLVALLEAFHALATWRDPRARLVVTGPVPMASFARVVQRWVEELALGAAWLAGIMAPGELRPVFERADAAVVFPGHEAARARAIAGRIPVVDFDGTDPLALTERLAAVRRDVGPDVGPDAGREASAPTPAPTGHPDPAAVARLVVDALS
jgi:hypothetical protein